MAGPSLSLLLLGKLAVIGATALGGAKLRLNAYPPSTCAPDAGWTHDCLGLDSHITRIALYAPWTITAVFLLVLSLPTVLLESRAPELGMQVVTSIFVHQTLLMLLSAGLPPTVNYALGLHACVHTLLTIRWGHHLVGGPLWWGLRFPAAVGLVTLAAFYGPPVSVVRWPGADSCDAIACAATAHLIGALLPDLALGFEMCLLTVAGWLFWPCE